MSRRRAREVIDPDVFQEWAGKLTRYDGTAQEMRTDCPWCGRDKLYVNTVKGVFFCQRCRETGPASKLVAKVDGLTSEEASRRLQGAPSDADGLRAALTLAGRPGGPLGDEGPVFHPLPPGFAPCFNGHWWRVPPYLDAPMPGGRGLSDEAIIRHGLGYCEEGRYRDRVVVPVIDGPHRTFLARIMGKPSDFAWTKSSTGELITPHKYMTPPAAGLSRLLYWLAHYPKGSHLIVVEGVFDAIRLIELGFRAVASFGKHLSAWQHRLLVEAEPRSVTFLRDAGAESDAWAEALALHRSPRASRLPVFVASCPHGHDPDSLGAALGRAGVRDALATSRRVEGDLGSLAAQLAALGPL